MMIKKLKMFDGKTETPIDVASVKDIKLIAKTNFEETKVTETFILEICMDNGVETYEVRDWRHYKLILKDIKKFKMEKILGHLPNIEDVQFSVLENLLICIHNKGIEIPKTWDDMANAITFTEICSVEHSGVGVGIKLMRFYRENKINWESYEPPEDE